MISQANALEIQAALNNAIQIESPPATEQARERIATAVGLFPTKAVVNPPAAPTPVALADVPHHLRKFVESDMRDAEQIRKWRNGESMKDEPRWLAPGIPTSYYAHCLAKEHGISHTADEVFESKVEPGIWYACVWTFNPRNNRIQIGAAYWHDGDTAKFFAYRNSIRQQLTGLCLQLGNSEKKTWRTSRRNAERRYA